MPDLTLHGLRHFAATYLIGARTGIRTAAGRLGHSGATTTLKVYNHLIESRDQAAADMLAQLVSGAG